MLFGEVLATKTTWVRLENDHDHDEKKPTLMVSRRHVTFTAASERQRPLITQRSLSEKRKSDFMANAVFF